MKLEKKLIACSILAIVIGVSSVFPLAFFMSATAKADTSNEPWFSINIPYAYWVTSDGPLEMPFEPNYPDGFEMNETNSVSEQHMLVLNITLNDDTAKQPVDAQFEYYQIDVSSDKELIGTMRWVVGTNINSSFNVSGILGSFSFMRNEWFDTRNFDTRKYGGGGGLTRPDWTPGLSMLWPMAGAGSGTIGSSGSSGVVSILREAETVFISIYRIGWVTFSGNSTTVTYANNELVEQVQLEKFGEEGWLYNNLIPEEELATADLTDPIGLLK
ncbi:hypothetical protein GH146_04750 [archaeon]|nr:hypothetical protein [archaeon]